MTPEERIETMLLLKERQTQQKNQGNVPGSDNWFYYETDIQEAKIKIGEIAEYTPELKAHRLKLYGQTGDNPADAALKRDQAMGQSMFGMLAPSGVKLATGDLLKAGETRITDNSEIVVSAKATWYDSVVGVERAKRAPTIKVVYDHLGQEMGEVWKAIEEASAAYRQAAWTHNPTLLHDIKQSLSGRAVTDLNQAITNASLGLGVPQLSDADKASINMAKQAGDTTTVMAAVRQEWISEHADEVETAVRLASDASEEQSLEELFNIAYWMGCEMQMIDDQVDSPDTTGEGEESGQDGSDAEENNEGESGENPEGDFDQGEDDGADSDSEDSGDSADAASGDSDTDSGGSEESASQEDSDEESGSGDEDGGGLDSETESSDSGEEGGDPESSQGGSGSQGDQSSQKGKGKEGGLGSGSDRPDGQQMLDAMGDAMSDVQEVKANESDSFNAVHPYERWIVIDGKTHDMKPHTNVKLAMDDFVGNDEYKESHFGDPDPDLIHELRLGNMDVFEVESETQGRIVVVVDCSSSMNCWCDQGHNKIKYRKSTVESAENGWLAWQAAGAIHRQFPDAEVFGYSSGSGISNNKAIRTGSVNYPVVDASPDWTNGAPDRGSSYKPGGYHYESYKEAGKPGRMDEIWSSNSGYNATRIVPIKTPGHRPACNQHDKDGLLYGGTPEAGALSYLVKRLDAAFETSVGILITDGEPNNSARSYAMTRRMHKAGMRFGVISINYTDSGIYPASMLHHIDKPEDLQKLPAIFEFITGGNQ